MKRHEIDLGNGRTRIYYEEGHDNTPNRGIKVMEHQGSDGSKLSKPMSQTYMNSIKRRISGCEDKIGAFKPSDYGAGKKIPRNFR